MSAESLSTSLVLALVQGVLALGGAPLLYGLMRRVKARFQYRHGPSIWQPYHDLRKWWGKTAVESDAASPLTGVAPAIVLTAMIVALLILPIVALRSPLERSGDLLVVLGLLALARFVLALAALDAGSAFGGMGASRDVAIASLVEPGVLLALAVVVAGAGTTDLAGIAGQGAGAGLAMYTPALVLALIAFAIVAIAETGHEPVDNPDTHLELTMIHEGMLLEASGRRLAILMYASQIRLVVVLGLFTAVFMPFGAATEMTAPALALGVMAAAGKFILGAGLLATVDAGVAKLRILALPGLLGLSSLLALTALAVRLWLPA
ncbi:MAG: NADH-quinone oxidoreductase subunit H [Chloroflexota bacterium]